MQMVAGKHFPRSVPKIVIDTPPFNLINSNITKPIFFQGMSMIPAWKARR